MNFFDQNSPIRGYRIPLAGAQDMFRELNALTAQEKERFLATVVKPEMMPEEEFLEKLELIRNSAFRVTVTINGTEGEFNFGDNEKIFTENTLRIISSIYMTNLVSYKGVFGNEPARRFEITLSFEKPPALDWNPLVSAPTANGSSFVIRSDESSYARAVEGIINRTLSKKRAWYSFIHAPLVYDAFIWLFAFPYSAYQVSRAISVMHFPEDLRDMRFLAAIYMVILMMLFWRFLFSYAKWVFPVNVLTDNVDHATMHRWLVGAIFLGVSGNFAYEVIKMFLRVW